MRCACRVTDCYTDYFGNVRPTWSCLFAPRECVYDVWVHPGVSTFHCGVRGTSAPPAPLCGDNWPTPGAPSHCLLCTAGRHRTRPPLCISSSSHEPQPTNQHTNNNNILSYIYTYMHKYPAVALSNHVLYLCYRSPNSKSTVIRSQRDSVTLLGSQSLKGERVTDLYRYVYGVHKIRAVCLMFPWTLL